MNQSVVSKKIGREERHTVLFGFWNNLSSHPEPSSLNHSYGYASADDRPACVDKLTQQPNPGKKSGLAKSRLA